MAEFVLIRHSHFNKRICVEFASLGVLMIEAARRSVYLSPAQAPQLDLNCWLCLMDVLCCLKDSVEWCSNYAAGKRTSK